MYVDKTLQNINKIILYYIDRIPLFIDMILLFADTLFT